jgi:hypothetical protein
MDLSAMANLDLSPDNPKMGFTGSLIFAFI